MNDVGMSASATSESIASLLQLSTNFIVSRGVQVAVELGIPDRMGDGETSLVDLAQGTSCDPATLARLLRMLAGWGIVTDTSSGYRLTALGQFLRSEVPGSLQSWFRLSFRSYTMFDGLLESVRTGKPAFEQVYGASYFDYFAANPAEGAVFDKAMEDFGRMASGAVIDAYDFTKSGRIVDVGGGTGHYLTQILSANPASRGILFDQPHVAAAAEASLKGGNFEDRIQVAGGDFFTSVPAGGDLYLLAWIIHDWDDEDAVRILRNCRTAMKPGNRLLIVESVVPEDAEPHLSKLMDLVMLVGLGGRERTRAQYSELLANAGFTLGQVIPTKSPQSLLEATLIR
ncbi:methyltransferase [Streptomyces sp. NPDC005574]|uniref:methyltransferase n=1 Tax=Streptomyces sp. NPDC005574 TaxID=3156891 RepID=UPI0033A61E38